MKRSVLVVILLVLAAPCLASGQPQTPAPPTPGPEYQRLGYFVGTWKTDSGETVTYEWFTGGFSLIGRVENSGPAHPRRGPSHGKPTVTPPPAYPRAPSDVGPLPLGYPPCPGVISG